jgi:thiol:disulfide interchange protein DsbD
MRYLNILLLAALIYFSVGNTYSQFGLQNNIVKIETYQSLDKIYPGGEFKLAIEADVKESWHINSNKPKDEFLIPTTISLEDTTNFKLLKIVYPAAKEYIFDFSSIPVLAWEGKVFFGALVKTTVEIVPGDYDLIVELGYQACNNQSCLPPTRISQQSVANLLETNGILLGLIIVFLGGLALNLTPCVYPLIPITIGYFGGQSEGSTKRLMMMGVLFVLGLAVTYSIIGVITSLTGAVFGALLQNQIVIVFVALILVTLSLSMFGVYEFKLPDKIVAKAGGAKGGYYGAFFMGLTMGIVAAPCIGPFVLGLVTYVASKQDPLFGFIMFFVLAIGLGTPYLFLAIFSGKIKNLPRAGEWMQGVEHIFGLVLVGMAIYFLLPLFPSEVSGYILPIYMILAGIYLLFFEKKASSIKVFKIFRTAFSVILIAVAVYNVIPTKTMSVEWQPYSEAALASLNSRGVIIDFYADWCIPCKELDAFTFSDPEVIKVSEEFDTYKADLTKSLAPEVASLREKYNIIGVPTVLILNSKGEESERITGFVTAEEFMKIISRVN